LGQESPSYGHKLQRNFYGEEKGEAESLGTLAYFILAKTFLLIFLFTITKAEAF